MKPRSGIRVLKDHPGDGEPVVRLNVYRIRLRMWLNRGEPVRWPVPWGFVDRARLEDDGETLLTDVRVDRNSLIVGLFHGCEGMKVGGTRKLRISPHLAYGDRGVPGIIPADAVLDTEISFLERRVFEGLEPVES